MEKRKRGSDEENDLRILDAYLFKIGLWEVDKLFQTQRIINPATNCVSGRVVDVGSKNTEDRISRLPDGILQFIISLLKMREGAATSILRRRWRNLWITSISRLNFNEYDLYGSKYLHSIRKKRKVFPESQKTKFIRQVNHILQLRRALKMDTLQVSFPLYEDHAAHIDRWLELASSQGVTKLELHFDMPLSSCLSYYFGKKYTFPVQRYGSSLNYLSLSFCIIEFPPDFQGLNSLISLNLSECFLTTNDVQTILSNCCSLEWLSLKGCNSPDLTILKFVGPSIRLKHLHISGCDGIEKIDVHDVNLLSFELDASEEPILSIKNVPHLARLVLHMDGPVKIPDNIPRLETLFLEHEESELPKLSVFNNLKRLVFTADNQKSILFEVVSFLEACPLLQQLELDMGIANIGLTDENSKISMRPRCIHSNLKEIRIYAFDSHPELIELAKYLLRNAIVLEKMIIHTTCKSYRGNGEYWLSKKSVKLVGMTLDKVGELLLKESLSSTKLLIL